ncbi:unnamed protein product, partial [Staurois parvus]
MYDMSEIDTREGQSILELIASSKKSQANKILNISPIKELLQKKWQRTGRPYIWILAIIYLTYMICVSLCFANRPIKPREDTTPIQWTSPCLSRKPYR